MESPRFRFVATTAACVRPVSSIQSLSRSDKTCSLVRSKIASDLSSREFLGERVLSSSRKFVSNSRSQDRLSVSATIISSPRSDPDDPPQRQQEKPKAVPVVVPTVIVDGKPMDLWSRLLKSRIVILGGSIDDGVANSIVSQLMYLAYEDPYKDIRIFVNSPGGSVTAGMAIFDTMNYIKPDVCTIVTGLAASMGAFILSAGKKGKRYGLPHSRVMIHQPLGGAQGQATDVNIQAQEILYHKRRLSELMAKHSGQPYEKIIEDTERDKFMSSFQAKEYGLIDEVIMPKRGVATTWPEVTGAKSGDKSLAGVI
eukprot:CAMPEP_0184644416 /NCGR_PEP_ID=MMETSP0308-20130426/1138_1 /TAXON_ID=38269 /ORGANISM="Gloeochaete witrockiana, Strain SAG 46.84" /LENGTH=311 /DNA_ID=CAMNT_0027072937 /DNA_START=64 /DNA_END=999 /DNA_ORIENTATION=-